MAKSKDYRSEKFLAVYESNKVYLSDNRQAYDNTLIADAGRFLKKYHDIAQDLCDLTGDIIMTDIEAAAFALTIYDFGYENPVENHGWKSKMTVDLKTKKAEAVKRMRAWGIFPETVKQFKNEGLLSESMPPYGACFWVEGEQLARVRDFENKYNALVYFIIHSYTNIGELENYLYVSDYPEEWELDCGDIPYKQQICYVYNHDMPDCSESGSIGIERTCAAGLKRTW